MAVMKDLGCVWKNCAETVCAQPVDTSCPRSTSRRLLRSSHHSLALNFTASDSSDWSAGSTQQNMTQRPNRHFRGAQQSSVFNHFQLNAAQPAIAAQRLTHKDKARPTAPFFCFGVGNQEARSLKHVGRIFESPRPKLTPSIDLGSRTASSN